MQVLTDLKTRGVQDILIACVDGLTGFPDAIEAIFPKTTVQTCMVHLLRASLKYVPAPRARAGRPRPEADLHRQGRRPGPRRARGLRREVGPAVPGHHPGVAERLGARDPVPRVPRRGPPRDLHDERDRGAQPAAAQGDQDQGPASPTRTPPASSSTSRCRTPSRNGPGRGTGQPRCSRSRSTSVTASLTLQTDRHWLTPTASLLPLTTNPPTQLTGRPPHDRFRPVAVLRCAIGLATVAVAIVT